MTSYKSLVARKLVEKNIILSLFLRYKHYALLELLAKQQYNADGSEFSSFHNQINFYLEYNIELITSPARFPIPTTVCVYCIIVLCISISLYFVNRFVS